jgi:mannose-6-phosphate isomerase-like protein (cupin superfamily)
MPGIRRSINDCACYRIKASDTNYFVLLADPAADGTDFITVIEIFEPGGATPPNTHTAATEQFFVLAGEGRAFCDGHELPLARGGLLVVPPGTEHVVENTGPGKLYCLTTLMPDEGFADLVRAGIPVALGDDDRRVLCDALALAS